MHVRSEAVRARLHAASCKRREIISPSVLQVHGGVGSDVGSW